MRKSTEAETAVDTIAPTPSNSPLFCKYSAPHAVATQMMQTTPEWPRLNQRPTSRGCLPSAMSLLVTLSIAAMWSASTACRKPNDSARRPAEKRAGYACESTSRVVSIRAFTRTSVNTIFHMRAFKLLLGTSWSRTSLGSSPMLLSFMGSKGAVRPAAATAPSSPLRSISPHAATPATTRTWLLL